LNYKDIVDKHIVNCRKITIPKQKIKLIEEFVKAVVDQKKSESHHEVDKNNEYKRFYTGTLGEAALEELFGVDLIDWTVGNSALYNEADLRAIKMDVGIKTVSENSFPIIHKAPKRPEIINIREGNDKVIVCGFASVQTMEQYQDVNLIKSPSLRNRGVKTGFYGFEYLKTINSLQDLRLCLNPSFIYFVKQNKKWWD
jgi:hypothetical protein